MCLLTHKNCLALRRSGVYREIGLFSGHDISPSEDKHGGIIPITMRMRKSREEDMRKIPIVVFVALLIAVLFAFAWFRSNEAKRNNMARWGVANPGEYCEKFRTASDRQAFLTENGIKGSSKDFAKMCEDRDLVFLSAIVATF